MCSICIPGVMIATINFLILDKFTFFSNCFFCVNIIMGIVKKLFLIAPFVLVGGAEWTERLTDQLKKRVNQKLLLNELKRNDK